jgi:lysophospholipase L1-like esterase
MTTPLRLMPVGDSITRGSYLVKYAAGPYAGTGVGLPHPLNGGWRKPLQDALRQAGVACEFVGALDYLAYGRFGGDETPHAGAVDPAFQPRHHGLAGFGNQGILEGGVVPTPPDVLAALGVRELRAPGIVTALREHRPDVVLLLAGTNGFDAPARDRLVDTILAHLDGALLVATIPPQQPPRAGWEQVPAYNASLPAAVATRRAAGHRISLVDLHALLGPADLLPDGVHPTRAGMDRMAAGWFAGLRAAGLVRSAHAHSGAAP